ncbi:hypothetical protein BOX15_Mlig024393g2 [Macrostomum lignano]|uniref:Uncharacterized protein n=1 Tax=Macrostomum lignano TaxID=282301 RepID=A0A267DPL5_9PLAT|nr:hypothetical protein BOX15_Mlig024393g2 [Macrostomum lignano]
MPEVPVSALNQRADNLACDVRCHATHAAGVPTGSTAEAAATGSAFSVPEAGGFDAAESRHFLRFGSAWTVEAETAAATTANAAFCTDAAPKVHEDALSSAGPSRPGAVSTTSKSLLMRQQTSNDLFKLSSSRMRRSTAATRVAPGYWAMDSADAWEAEERAQQRRRIYALNKLMTELEEENYLAFKSSQQRAG